MDDKEMDSSDVLPGDWDIINSSISDSGDKEDLEEEENSDSSLPTTKEVNCEDVAPKGSTVEDIAPEVHDEFYNESNTSSDIDIIDEVIEYAPDISNDYDSAGYLDALVSESNPDDSSALDDQATISSTTVIEQIVEDEPVRATPERNVSRFLEPVHKDEISSMFMPTTFTTEDTSEPPPFEQSGPETERSGQQQSWFARYALPLIERLLGNSQLVHIATAMLLSFSFLIVFNTTELKPDSFSNLREIIGKLQAENAMLRNQITSKMETDKFLLGFEDQLEKLKEENSKLSASLRSLLHQLEKQTAALKKDHRGKGPYKEEFEKLKEQINILRNDNHALHSQWMRMKQNPAPQQSKKEEKKDEVKEDVDNSTEALTEEMKELRKQLYSEMDKLKEWKETILSLVNKFGDVQKENGKDNFKVLDDASDPKDKQEYWYLQDLAQNVEKKLWFLQDLKKNLEKSVEKINIPDMWKSMSEDSKKKAGKAFESVSHYFKKAQEKARKVLDYNNDNELWNILGEFRNHWSNMKNEFFDRHYGKKSTPEKDAETTDSTYTKAHTGRQDHGKYQKYKNQHDPKAEDFGRDHTDDEELYHHSTGKAKGNDESYPYRTAGSNKEMDEDESWMFERARRRSNFRKENEDDLSSNWFLRNRKNTDQAADNEE